MILYFYLNLCAKFFFILFFEFLSFFFSIFKAIFGLSPSKFFYEPFVKFFSFPFFYLKRAWFFDNSFRFFFFSFPFFIALLIGIACMLWLFAAPFFFLLFSWSLLGFFRFFLIVIVFGTFRYFYVYVHVLFLFVNRLVCWGFSFFLSCLSSSLDAVEKFLLFFSFFLGLAKEFPPVNSSRPFGAYRPSFFSFLNSFWLAQFGSFSNIRISEYTLKTDHYSIEPYFFVNLPESLIAEGIQIQEAMMGMAGSSYRRSSADSFMFLQVLKQHRVHVPERQPFLRLSKRFLSSYVLEDLAEVEFNYRMSWIKQNLPCFVPPKYEKYIFRKYLRNGLASILNYHVILNSTIRNYPSFLNCASFYIFKPLSFYPYLSNRLETLDFDLRNDYSQGFFNHFEFSDEVDVEYEEFGSPFSRFTGYAGFHYLQQLDDLGSFSKPYSYVAPKVDRYWFKRFLSSYFFKIRSRQVDDLGYFYQALHILAELAFAFLLFFSFLFFFFAKSFQFFFGVFFKSNPNFIFLFRFREGFFGFINFIFNSSKIFFSLQSFFLSKKVVFNVTNILDSALLRCFFFLFQIFFVFSSLKYLIFIFFTPLRFLKFLSICYREGRLGGFVLHEFGIRQDSLLKKMRYFLNFLKSGRFFN